MSKLIIKDTNLKTVEINLENITQLYGCNMEKKQFIFDSITKYFSRHKYSDDDYFMENNILFNNDKIGRNYFITSNINSIYDIDKELTNNKGTLITEYINHILNQFDINKTIDGFNNFIQKILIEVKESIGISTLDISINPTNYGPSDLIKNNLDIQLKDESQLNFKRYLPNIKKIQCYLELLEKIDSIIPKKRLILLPNIDSYLSHEQYVEVMQNIHNITKSHDITFIISCSTEKYCFINIETIPSINIINDIIFNVPSIEILSEYIINHYPYNRDFPEQEIIELLKPIIHKIGMKSKPITIESQVVLKLLNESENIYNTVINEPNRMELSYIQYSE